jgi:hypothetical protein
MLKLAYPYQEKLNKAWQPVVFTDKYKFYNCGNYWSYKVELDKDSWNKLQMVSVDANDNVIGYFVAQIDRECNKISNIGAINFGELNITFSKDLYRFLTELFTKYNYRKIEWFVVVGNPAEKIYDKIIAKYGGRVVGTKHASIMLSDGTLRDTKDYELFRDDFELSFYWHEEAASSPKLK